MYAVIFKAKIKKFDNEYIETASRMRDLAINNYGCLDFIASTEGDNEIAISYWPSQQHIVDWKNNPEHITAQKRGQDKWYESYTVEVVEVLRSYSGT